MLYCLRDFPASSFPPSVEEMWRKYCDGVVELHVSSANGKSWSGTAFHYGNGWFITNSHVITGRMDQGDDLGDLNFLMSRVKIVLYRNDQPTQLEGQERYFSIFQAL